MHPVIPKELMLMKRKAVNYQRQMMSRSHLEDMFERDKTTLKAMEDDASASNSDDGKTTRKGRKAALHEAIDDVTMVDSVLVTATQTRRRIDADVGWSLSRKLPAAWKYGSLLSR